MCTVWIVFAQLTLLSGPFGFVISVGVAFLGLYYLVNRISPADGWRPTGPPARW